MAHPSVPELLAAGDAPSEALATHLAGCASCRRLVARARPVTRTGPDLDRADLDLPVVDPAVYARRGDGEARGGMGRTFVALDRRLGREVAIKQPLGATDVPDPTLRATLRARFEREARLTARLEHPAIVAVHEAGRFAGGDAFYAMRRVAGRSLAELIAARPTLAERLALLPNLTMVAEALAYAHSRGVTHRDVTPANIMLGAFGETVLIDWGLAADAGGAPAPEPDGPYRAGELPLTAYGVGTPGYMAPEQARGVAADARADVYALGATLYHLVAGRPPDPGIPRPLATLAHGAPPPLIAVIERAMAIDPAARFPGAAELAAELRRFTTGQLMASHRYTPAELVRHYLRRYRAPLAVAAAALAVMIAVSVMYLRGLARERAETERARRAAEASDLQAQRALRVQLGVTASQLADQPERRLDALSAGVRGVAPARRAGEAPAPEAWQGLVDALAAGPVAAPLRDRQPAIAHAVFLPDARHVLTASRDHVLRVWDARSGRLVATHATTLDRPISLQLTPDGARALVCGYDARAELHALAGGAPVVIELAAGDARCEVAVDGTAVIAGGPVVRTFDARGVEQARATLDATITALGVAPDGRVALGTVAGDLVVWRPGHAPGAPVAAHPGGVQDVAWIAGGARLVSGGADGRARRWPVAAGDGDALGPPEVLHASTSGPISGLYATPGDDEVLLVAPRSRTDARDVDVVRVGGDAPLTLRSFAYAGDQAGRGGPAPLIAGLRDQRAVLIDKATGREVLRLAPTTTHTSALSRAGTTLLAGASTGQSLLWDVRSGPHTGVLAGHTSEVTALVARDGALITASLDGTVRAWPLDAAATADDGDAPGEATDLGSEVVALAAAPDGATSTAAPDGATIAVLGVDGAVRLGATTLASAEGPLAFVAFSPDGAELVAGAPAGRLARWDARTGAPRPALAIAAAPDGAMPPDVTCGAFSPDGARVALGGADGSVALLDAATGATLARLSAADSELNALPEGVDRVAFTPDGAALVVGFASPRTLVLDPATLAVRARLPGRAAPAAADALLARGLLATLDLEGRALLHPLAGGAPRALEAHLRPVIAAAASADGARLVTADAGGALRVWDVATGATLVAFTPGDVGTITALAFVDDDRVVALGTARGQVRIVAIDPDRALARACALLDYFERDEPACAPAAP